MRSRVARWGALVIVIGTTLGFAAPAHADLSAPNDQGFPLQWNLRMIGAPAAWLSAPQAGQGITIAIVDSGVDLNHEDLRDKVIGSVTCVDSASRPQDPCPDGGQDDNGHGSHVAGIAAAATDNTTGIAGVAPNAAILSVKVLTQSCGGIPPQCDASGSPDDVAAGIRYAADHGAAVINLSLGNTAQSVFGPAFQTAIDYAFTKGAIPVIAAGNDYILPSGGRANAIVVGALNKTGNPASYSNSIGDAQWAIMAPGGEGDTEETCATAPVGVLSTYLDNRYACLAGTSMAAPHVAGAAAVLRSMGRTQQETIDRLLHTARTMSSSTLYGAGALDLAAAAAPTQVTPPTDPGATDASTLSTGPATPGALGNGSDPGATASDGGAASTSTPSGDLGAPTSTSPAGVITLPGQQAAPANGGVTARTPPNDGLSAGLVAAAVLMAAGVSFAVGWFFLRGNSWARRTPPLPPSLPPD